jgi:hypothetical protein
VLHVIAGPVDAKTFLSEARWAVEMWKLAELEKQASPELFFRKAHLDRLDQITRNAFAVPGQGPQMAGGKRTASRGPMTMGMAIAGMQNGQIKLNSQLRSPQAKVHQLLAGFPLPQIEDIYRLVFERILNQRLSTVPVNKG